MIYFYQLFLCMDSGRVGGEIDSENSKQLGGVTSLIKEYLENDRVPDLARGPAPSTEANNNQNHQSPLTEVKRSTSVRRNRMSSSMSVTRRPSLVSMAEDEILDFPDLSAPARPSSAMGTNRRRSSTTGKTAMELLQEREKTQSAIKATMYQTLGVNSVVTNVGGLTGGMSSGAQDKNGQVSDGASTNTSGVQQITTSSINSIEAEYLKKYGFGNLLSILALDETAAHKEAEEKKSANPGLGRSGTLARRPTTSRQRRFSESSVPVLKQKVTDMLAYTIPPGLPQHDYFDLLKRSSLGNIAHSDQDMLFKFFLAIQPSVFFDLQRAAQDALAVEKNQNKGFLASAVPFVEVSKYTIDFKMKGRNIKLNEEVQESIVLEAKSGRFSFSLITGDNPAEYELKVDPSSGKMKAKELMKITFSLTFKRSRKVDEVVTLDIEGGTKHYFIVSANSEWSHFGADLSDPKVEFEEHEIYPSYPHRVPSCLVTMYTLMDELGALETEEIFRKQLTEETLAAARNRFDAQEKLEELTPEALSNLIKVWFRELPRRILNIDTESIMNCDTPEKCLQLLEKVAPEQKDIALWIFDFMCKVVDLQEKNRMTAKKLAIVMAPNIFNTSTGGATNAKYLRKTSEIFTTVVESRLKIVHTLPPENSKQQAE